MLAPVAADPLCNPEAEAALLGALMSNNKTIDTIADRLDAEDFSDELMANVYSAIIREHSLGKPANPISLRPYFENDAVMASVGGPGYLADLTGQGRSIGTAGLANQISELASRRRLVDALGSAIDMAQNPASSIAELAEIADAGIFAATRTRGATDEPTAGQCLGNLVSTMNDEIHGVTCRQIPSLDQVLGPLGRKQLIIGAGRPGMGKTAVAVSYAIGAASAGHGVLFVSLEMSADDLGERMAADICFEDVGKGVPYKAITDRTLNTYQQREICRAKEMADDLPLVVIDTGSLTIGRLGMIVRRQKRRFAARGQSLDLVIVDYLQLLQSDHRGRGEYERVSEVSVGLKAIAKDQDLAMFALAQLSREVEKREDKKPVLSDLRSSGQIEQDADAILFLFRLEYYLRQNMPDEGHADRQKVETALEGCKDRIDFIVAKRRRGVVGSATGYFFGGYQAVRG